MRTDYQAQLDNLDFASPDAPAIVNKWVSDKTHGKITQLVDSFDPTTVGYLVNATFFHALWATEFKAMSGKQDFHQFDGTAAQLPFMSREESVTELRAPGYFAELLPYKGGRFSAVLILPASALSPSEFGTFLSPTLWAEALAHFHSSVGDTLGGKCTASSSGDSNVQCDGSLQIPKFKLDYGKDLTGTLGAMGMPIPGAALPQFCDGCAISTVVQKTYLEVDEKGTTAAAATGVAVEASAKLPTVVDRPFAFALIDNATDAPLFLGAIGNLG
jgi:serpin B